MAERKREDLYAVLGVDRKADAETIKTAYRKLARQLHPDVNPGDTAAEERFKKVSEAYSVLSDSGKRADYDEFGDVSLESGFDPEEARRMREAFGAQFRGGAAPGASYRHSEEIHYDDLDEMLGRFFRSRPGGEQRRPRGMPGPDVEATLELDFLEAVKGGEKRLVVPRPAADGSVRSENVTVRIPAGVADGGRIRIRGKGGEGLAGGRPGDLWATIRIRPHPWFRREGRDVHIDAPVTILEAVRGAKIEIPALEGRVTVSLPPGTDGGQVLRLAGKGIADPGGGPPGDFFVHVQIRVPRGLDEAALEKLEEVVGFGGEDPRKELFS